MLNIKVYLGWMSSVRSQALLPCLGAQACTRVLHTMISARWMIRQSRRNTDHSTEKGWPRTVWADLEEPRSECTLILGSLKVYYSDSGLFTFN